MKTRHRLECCSCKRNFKAYWQSPEAGERQLIFSHRVPGESRALPAPCFQTSSLWKGFPAGSNGKEAQRVGHDWSDWECTRTLYITFCWFIPISGHLDCFHLLAHSSQVVHLFFSQQLWWLMKQPRVNFLPSTGLHEELELWYQQQLLVPICLLEECRWIWVSLSWFLGFPGGSAGKESACNVGDLGLIPGLLGRSPGEGKGYPRQYSGLENSMDCIVHGVAKSWTRLSDFFFTSPLGYCE